MTDPRIALEILSGKQKGTTFVIEDSTLIGSGSICDLLLEDENIASMHAKLAPKANGTFAITDLTKAPDLFVNNVMVKSRVIKVGDEIRIAGIRMRIFDPTQNTATLPTQDAVVEKEQNDPAFNPPPPTPAVDQHSQATQRVETPAPPKKTSTNDHPQKAPAAKQANIKVYKRPPAQRQPTP